METLGQNVNIAHHLFKNNLDLRLASQIQTKILGIQRLSLHVVFF